MSIVSAIIIFPRGLLLDRAAVAASRKDSPVVLQFLQRLPGSRTIAVHTRHEGNPSIWTCWGQSEWLRRPITARP